MGLAINHNIMALMAANNLMRSYGALSKSVNRLSSGLRIKGAADDAAGLAVRELMRSDVAVLNQGIRNANDAISMLQTMDGAASVIDEKLIRMKELAEQAATGTYSDTQRQIMDNEFAAMRDEITRIANATDFNGIKMLDGASAIARSIYVTADTSMAAASAFISAFTNYASGETLTISYIDHNGNVGAINSVLQIGDSITEVISWIDAQSATTGFTASYDLTTGRLTFTDTTSGESQLNVWLAGGASYSGTVDQEGSYDSVKIHFGTGNSSAEDYYYVNKQDMTATGLGLDSLSIAIQASAQAALSAIDAAIIAKDTARAHFGAMINRLQNTVTNLTIQAENVQAAESQISDVDVAFEMTNFINTQIKAQAAIAMLAQANMLPQLAMSLIGG
jgi:flagellin